MIWSKVEALETLNEYLKQAKELRQDIKLNSNTYIHSHTYAAVEVKSTSPLLNYIQHIPHFSEIYFNFF